MVICLFLIAQSYTNGMHNLKEAGGNALHKQTTIALKIPHYATRQTVGNVAKLRNASAQLRKPQY
jgi:hypothetical protein